jgi:D-3-phosphoglycerate dehydrogenase
MVDATFINAFASTLVTILLEAKICNSRFSWLLWPKEVLGAGLDVLEYEKLSFNSFQDREHPEAFKLLKSDNVILSPHVAGLSRVTNVGASYCR